MPDTSSGRPEPVLLGAGSVFAAHRHNGDGKHLTQPMDTVTSTPEKAVLFAAVNNFQGAPRGTGDPLPTQLGSETLGIVTAGPVTAAGVILQNQGIDRRVSSVGEPLKTLVADNNTALLFSGPVTAAGVIKNNGGIDEARYRAHPVSAPLGAITSSASQGLLFGGWYKQNGPTGTETAPHPVTDPFGTFTSRDTTGLLAAEWHEALEALALEDCYFRMMAAHEVGRGCGFDTTFPDRPGQFVVWGTARDQVDGFGNAVSPAVGAWIGQRLRAALHTVEAIA